MEQPIKTPHFDGVTREYENCIQPISFYYWNQWRTANLLTPAMLLPHESWLSKGSEAVPDLHLLQLFFSKTKAASEEAQDLAITHKKFTVVNSLDELPGV